MINFLFDEAAIVLVGVHDDSCTDGHDVSGVEGCECVAVEIGVGVRDVHVDPDADRFPDPDSLWGGHIEGRRPRSVLEKTEVTRH